MAQCQTKWNLILGSSPCRFRFLLWSIPSFLSMCLCGRCMYHAYLGALPSECLEVLTVIVTWSLQVPQRFLLFEALLGSRASGNPARTVGNLWWTKHLSKSSDCKTLVDQKLIDFECSQAYEHVCRSSCSFFVAPHEFEILVSARTGWYATKKLPRSRS